MNRIHNVLTYTFVIIPIVAGADKFFNLLVQLDSYLSPFTRDLLPMTGVAFMKIVGVIEILAGIIVLFKTQLGAYIVSDWLTLIAPSLLLTCHHADVAVRDLAMAISAFVLAKISGWNAQVDGAQERSTP